MWAYFYKTNLLQTYQDKFFHFLKDNHHSKLKDIKNSFGTLHIQAKNYWVLYP